MHYRFIAMLVCFISLQSSAVTEDSVMQRARTMTPLREIETLSSLSLLPTSAPATPQDALDKFFKTTKSSCDFMSLVRKKEKCQADLKLIEKYIDAKMFIQKLIEEKLAKEKLAKEKLAEQKHQERFRESNSCGYFPHSGIVYETHLSNTHYDQGDWYP